MTSAELKRLNKSTWFSWYDMLRRCYNTKSQRYYTHGSRGIYVCNDWKESFVNFYNDLGPKPDGKTLDRVDNNSNYTKDNCKWSTPKEQALNRRTNRLFTLEGETKTISEWATQFGISHGSMTKRLRKWDLEKALSSIIYEKPAVDKELIRQIIQEYKDGGLSQKALGVKYNVSQAAISKWFLKDKNKYEA